MRKVIAIVIVLAISMNSNLWSNQNKLEKKVHIATRIRSLPPVIDGHLNDPCWQGGDWAGDFIQREPRGGESPSQNTIFKILYDDKNLYLAIRAFDTEPEIIERQLGRRDAFRGDVAGFAIDSYFDHRTAFEFTITAAGAKIDMSHLSDGKRWSWDTNWDAVWHGKTALEDSAWTAEMRVPFSQLRFGKKDEHIWGLLVFRIIYRKHEEDLWIDIPMDAQGGVHLFGELHGIKGIKMPRRIELLPYTVGKTNTFQKEEGNPFATGRRSSMGVGLDGKIGVSSDFTLDLTMNPDFGQVEADPSVINLSAFETFYVEKRPFFLEGKSITDFRLGSDILFYSRRIGHAPSYHPDLKYNEHVKMPENTSIISALKLTGKTKNGLSIGIIENITAQEKAEIHSAGQYRDQTVEPLSNYFVGRIQKDYYEGNTTIGGIFTGTHRHISAEHLQILNQSAYSVGLDLSHQWSNRSYYLDIKTISSHIRGTPQALLSVQTASRHYFQRPDVNHVTLDTNRTNLSGHGGSIEVGRGGNGNLRYSESVSWRSPGLELNDLGYLRMADIIKQNTTVGYVVNKPIGILRNYSLYLDQYTDWNIGGEILLAGASMKVEVQFTNNWGFASNFVRDMGFLDTRVLRGGPSLKLEGNWSHAYTFYSNRRKILSFDFNGRNIWFDDGVSKFFEINPGISFRVSNALNLSAKFSYAFNRDNLQYVETRELYSEDRYILGRIDQKTIGITFRLNYSLTPDLSIQYYGQPFVSAGKYSDFKKITSPRAKHYADRFHTFSEHEIVYDPAEKEYLFDEDQDLNTDYSIHKPDFNFLQFRSNLVIRWEYSAGSTLYLVWSQGRKGYVSNGYFSFRNDLQELYNIYPDNIFLIKFSHWFSL